MHSGLAGRADGFLRRLYHELAASPSWRPGTLLVVTCDPATRTIPAITGPRGPT